MNLNPPAQSRLGLGHECCVNHCQFLTTLNYSDMSDFGAQQIPHLCLTRLKHTRMNLSNVSSNASHLDAHCSFTGQPSASCSAGWGMFIDLEFLNVELSIATCQSFIYLFIFLLLLLCVKHVK